MIYSYIGQPLMHPLADDYFEGSKLDAAEFAMGFADFNVRPKPEKLLSILEGLPCGFAELTEDNIGLTSEDIHDYGLNIPLRVMQQRMSENHKAFKAMLNEKYNGELFVYYIVIALKEKFTKLNSLRMEPFYFFIGRSLNKTYKEACAASKTGSGFQQFMRLSIKVTTAAKQNILEYLSDYIDTLSSSERDTFVNALESELLIYNPDDFYQVSITEFIEAAVESSLKSSYMHSEED